MVGNLPNYSKIDILRCFIRLGVGTSRQHLAKELGIGEGTIRTILDILKSEGLLDSTKKGHFLSTKGIKLQAEIFKKISAPKILEIDGIYPGYKKIGVQIKNSKKLAELYRLRDIAVKNGAEGAIILKFENRLYIPESQDDDNNKYEEIEKKFNFENGDVLVIGFSGNNKNAETGALSIAVELSGILQKFINKF